jgi:hypothetical protein
MRQKTGKGTRDKNHKKNETKMLDEKVVTRDASQRLDVVSSIAQ